MALEVTEVAKQVEKALKEDERTADYPLEVVEHDGLVTLKGNVPSAEVKEAAETIAESQEGVVDVTNALVVDPKLGPEGDAGVIVAPPTTNATKNAASPPYGQ
jgi:osmotically-inducible protein OsmY